MPERRHRDEAAALRYEPGSDAPRVVASGRGAVARRIVETAAASGVPVRHDRALAEALTRLELELEIPPQLYAAVAETLAWAYSLDLEGAPEKG